MKKKKSRRGFLRKSGWSRVLKEDRENDMVFLWKIEQHKLQNMLKFWENYDKQTSYSSKATRELRIALRLMDIFINEEDHVWDIIRFPEFIQSTTSAGTVRYTIDPEDRGEIKRIGYINMRNIARHVGLRAAGSWSAPEPGSIARALAENQAWIQKARSLYHLFRTYYETGWWV